jgi:tRNA A37 threonylcarbamoyladenosine dehydratase
MTEEGRWERSARLVGSGGLRRLGESTVAVFGLGGVGSHCAEALARSSVGRLRLVDHDVVSASNANRQLVALESTLGQSKTAVMAARLVDVAPGISVDARQAFFAADTADELLGGPLSWVVDAIDGLGPKVELVRQCQERGIKVVTVLGAACRLDPTRIRVATLEHTHDCPLAAKVRKHLRKRGSLSGVVAVFCEGEPLPPASGDFPKMTDGLCRGRQRTIQPSMVMVPAAMGFVAASVVVRDIALGPGRPAT